MILSRSIKSFGLMVLILFTAKAYSTRCNCTSTITDNSVSSYTISAGNKVCLVNGLSYTGTITLNGGVLCNYGEMLSGNLIMVSGQFNNYGKLKYTATTYITSSGNIQINCFGGSTLEATSDLYVSTTYSTDTVFFNLMGDDAVVDLYSLSQDKGCLYINLDRDVTELLDKNTFNIDQSLSMSGTSKLYLKSSSNSTFNAVYTYLNNSKKNYIENNGTMYLGVYFLVYSNEYLNLINTGDFKSDYIGIYDDARITNIGSAANSFSFGTYYQDNIYSIADSINFISNGGVSCGGMFNNFGVFNNYGSYSSNSFYSTNGTTNNYKNFTCPELSVLDNAVFNNYATITASLYISVSAGTFNGYGKDTSVISTASISNTGTINLSQGVFFETTDFENGPEGYIYGPSSISSDTSNYASILISGYSISDGYLQDYLYLYDSDLTGGGAIRLDSYSNESGIATPTVIFGPKCITKKKIILDRTSYCVPANATCTFVSLHTATGTFTWSYSGTYSTATSSGTPNTVYAITSLSTAGTVSASGNVIIGTFTCPVSASIALPVGAMSLNITSPQYFILGDPYTLNATVINGTSPIGYTWTPATYLTPTNTILNPQASPPWNTNYTLSASDNYGCSATATLALIPFPYAPLKSVPDGGHYLLSLNKMLFKVDGQYALTTLNYRLYDSDNVIVASSGSPNLVYPQNLIQNSGDNRYYLNATYLPLGYYTLEVTNEKMERTYLRFKR